MNVDVVQRYDGCISPTTAALVAVDRARLICTYNDPAVATGVDDLGTGLRRVQELTRGIVGVTLGRDSFLWLEDGGERRVPAPVVNAIDTLAAGDVFPMAHSRSASEKARRSPMRYGSPTRPP